MGGVAGHAGLFSTADDLAKYAEAMLNARVASAEVTRLFTTPQGPPDQPVLRGLGWDIDSPYSSNRGDRYPIGSYGHTGFTGTSLWIDPASHSYVIILTNRVHPKDGRSINAYRRAVTTTIADALGVKAPPLANHQVLNGIDVLAAEKFASLKGKHVGLITNQTGIDRNGKRSIDVLRAGGVDLVALFSPEHGINGTEDRPDIGNSKDSASGLPVWSLYNNGKYRMTPEMLKGVDTVLFDIQDVGARYYTYSCTMLYALEESAKAKVAFWVLDRPNPVTGEHADGPMLDDSLHSNVGCYSLPVRHGLTMGELATMANAERKLGASLNVVKMKNWARFDWFDSTNLAWIDPSPNMRSLNAATLYTGLALIESSKNLSVGRGTDSPFEQIGADFIDPLKLADRKSTRLNSSH